MKLFCKLIWLCYKTLFSFSIKDYIRTYFNVKRFKIWPPVQCVYNLTHPVFLNLWQLINQSRIIYISFWPLYLLFLVENFKDYTIRENGRVLDTHLNRSLDWWTSWPHPSPRFLYYTSSSLCFLSGSFISRR